MSSKQLQYTVLAGDSLSKIANEINASTGITSQQIEKANPGIQANFLVVGQVLNIPDHTGTTALRYTVHPGDSLDSIATAINEAAGVTYQEIASANVNIHASTIFPGEVLIIPGKNDPAASKSGSDSTSAAAPVNPTVAAAENVGYWHWTYHRSIAPANTTMGMAFYGAVDPTEAIQQSEKVKSILKGEKYICLGGGTSAGKYSADAITKIINAIHAGDFVGYQGIAFDVEVGAAHLETNFQQLFAATKAAGFKVLVTVSHSRPYGIDDGSTLTRAFFADGNIDFLSPQLYTTGKESSNDYTAFGIKWPEYAGAKAAVIPSIVKADYYSDAVTYFQSQGVTLKGFVQWSQA